MNSFNKPAQITLFTYLIHFLFFSLISITLWPLSSHGCYEEERRALLKFKSSLDDPSDRLSTWQESFQHRNCCDWHGIRCSDESHVVSIDLRNTKVENYISETISFSDFNPPSTALRGKLPTSLLSIEHLEYLDLAFNDFHHQEPEIPFRFSELTKLTHLDLSSTNFSASITQAFTFVSTLQYLDLSCSGLSFMSCFKTSATKWMRGLANLRVLRLSGTDMSQATPSKDISYLWNLRDLDISGCQIFGLEFPVHEFHNLSRLSSLKMSQNFIFSPIPQQIGNLTSLSILDLSANTIQGSIPESICEMSSLRFLRLHNNNITGTLPSCITNLRNLSVFDVSINSITGTVSFSSLINELNLTTLGLNLNKLNVVIDQPLRPSKFILEKLWLGSCNIEGIIPTFICNSAYLKYLDLSNNNLIGIIPSCISKLKYLIGLSLSANRLRGSLPLLPPGLLLLDLSHNKLTGEISVENEEAISSVVYIILNDNELSGSIPSSLCSQKTGFLFTNPAKIDLSHNKLSGIIPSSIGYCQNLRVLNLSNNSLTGNVPYELKQAEYLEYLQLNDNNLNGTFPLFTKKLLHLRVLHLGNNNFEGIIPHGLGSLNDLKVLSLRSNRFNGSIPEDIIHLQHLQILDFALNNFSGPIPLKLGNLKSLTGRISTIDEGEAFSVQYHFVIKGTTTHFESFFLYTLGIDLSCNFLTGSIPKEIGLLQRLGMLNLSHNLLSSNIPSSVGNMSSLESLDLSSNGLSGHIPQSLTSIDSLGILNLSNNNFSGRIPRASHFDTLSVDGSAFSGNELLCGFPMEKDCEDDHNISSNGYSPSSKVDEDDQEEGNEKFLLYAIVAMGCVVGFWGLFFVLLLNKHKWWFPYWRVIDSVAVKIVEG